MHSVTDETDTVSLNRHTHDNVFVQLMVPFNIEWPVTAESTWFTKFGVFRHCAHVRFVIGRAKRAAERDLDWVHV